MLSRNFLTVNYSTLQGIKPPILIFVQSKERAQELFRELIYEGISVDVMHAERTQAQVMEPSLFQLYY